MEITIFERTERLGWFNVNGNMNMSFFKWLITIVICLSIAGALAYFKLMEIQGSIADAAAYPEQSETVEEAFVSVSEYQETLTVVGEIIAPQRLDLRNEIPGEITAINFLSGSNVEAGQLLLQFDTEIEEANLRAARADVELSQQIFDRNMELYGKGVTNDDQLDRAKAALTAALAQIDVLEHTIEKKTLRSPFSGRAGLHNFEVGQYLQSNTLISNLVGDTDIMWVDFQVPQFYRQLTLDTALEITMIEDGVNSTKINATVIAENTILNARNRSRLYRASISNLDGNYVANSIANVEVPIGGAEVLLQVPAVAIQNDPRGQFIYVLHADENGRGYRAKRQQVNIKLIAENYVLLESGSDLSEGDRIAAAGAFKLREGILVFIGVRKEESISQYSAEAQVTNGNSI